MPTLRSSFRDAGSGNAVQALVRIAQAACVMAFATCHLLRSQTIEFPAADCERFQHVAHLPWRGEIPEGGLPTRWVEVDRTGGPMGHVPASVDRSGPTPVLSLLLPGITAPGESRRVRAAVGEAATPEETDLGVEVTDDHVLVRNAYMSVRHPRRGGGGFPDSVHFSGSGRTERDLRFLDRLYHRETGRQLWGDRDGESTADVVFESPLRIVVEARFRYAGGGVPAEPPTAVYRYVYSAHSPAVRVEGVVRQAEPFRWDELHILELSREDHYYTQFVTGEPATITPMQAPGAKSRGLSGSAWGVMATDEDAMGVGFGPVVCWDASDEFVYYTSRHRSVWQSTEMRVSGVLYFGPSGTDPEWYGRWLRADRFPAPRVVSAAVPAAPAEVPHYDTELSNGALRLLFGSSEEGFPCVGVLAGDESPARFVHAAEDGGVLWRVEFRTPWGSAEGELRQQQVLLDSLSAADRSAEIGPSPTEDGQRLVLRWEGLDLPGEPDVVSVRAEIDLADDVPESRWRLHVDNRSTRFGVWQTHYPVLTQVIEPGEGDALLPRGNWGGTLVRSSRRGATLPYPSAACPVQFMAFNRGGRGLYIGAHDGGARPKTLSVTPSQDVSIITDGENMGVPGADAPSSYPVVLRAYAGDWWQAAQLYRRWALQQPWAAAGPLVEREDGPEHLYRLALWFIGSGEAEGMLENMRRADALCDIPIGVHWYNWHQIPFDHTYPEYFPTKPGVPDAVRELVEEGHVIMPYINARLWDRDIESFANEGLAAACKQPSGEPYTEVYGSGRRLSPMCPATRLWQERVREICHGLAHDVQVNAIYLDQIGAAKPRLCFDPSHGHALGGGTHWVDGYRTMMRAVRAEAVTNGVALTTENTAEPYMDTIDAYLTWTERHDEDVPLLPAVYAGHTVYFSSPQSPTDDLPAFIQAQGRDFLWGCQLGWNSFWLLDPAHRDKLEFQLELAHLWQSARRFLLFGRLLDEIRPDSPVPEMTVHWHRRNRHAAVLPAVQGTIWRSREGETGVFLVNGAETPQEVSFEVDPALWGGQEDAAHGWLVTEFADRREIPVFRLGPGVPGLSLCLGPQAARGFVLRPLGADEAAALDPAITPQVTHEDTRDRVARFGVASLLASARIEVQLPRQTYQVAVGDAFPVACTLRNAGAEAMSLTLTWPDGVPQAVRLEPGDEEALTRRIWCEPGDSAFLRRELRVTLADGRSATHPFYVVHHEPVEVTIGSVPGIRSGESVSLPVGIRNRSARTRDVVLDLAVPAGWRVEPSARWSPGPLASGARRHVLLKCTAGPVKSSGTARIRARVLQSAAETTVQVHPARPRAVARRLETAPVIDGDLAEWAAGDEIRLGGDAAASVRVEEDYGGASDCSAVIRLRWDDDHLYLAAEVVDDTHAPTGDGPGIWQGDCLQLAIRNLPPPSTPGFDGRECEVGLSDAGGTPRVFRWMPDAGPLPDGELAVVRRDSTTVYEAAIPWADLGVTPVTTGRRLAWSCTVNENDGEGFRGWLEWTPGICGGKDSSAFGWLLLEP